MRMHVACVMVVSGTPHLRVASGLSEKENGFMDPTTLDAYRQRLLAQQQQIVRRIFELEADLQDASRREIEYVDRAQAEMPEEVLNQLDAQSRREWEDIQAALARMEAGTYGRCEACGQDILPARLDALPMARYCVHCQERRET